MMIDETEYYSNCCDAPPLYEIDEFNGKYSGICMKCKEGAVFYLGEDNEI